jgi:uncharacterized Zn finger protein
MVIKITEEAIRARATDKVFERGLAYYRQGAIKSTIKRGLTLEAQCKGSTYKPYHVQVYLNDDGNVDNVTCTCQYEFEGDCKHIVALLLTYVYQPEIFQERLPIGAILKELSHEELVTLMTEIIERQPKLQAAVDRAYIKRRKRKQ